MGLLYPDLANGRNNLQIRYNVTCTNPFDIRDTVRTFEDLLDVDSTFSYAVYETMKVLVRDEAVLYELIWPNDATLDESLRGEMIGNAFDDTNTGNNKKFWKRITIETIAESVATDEDMMKAQAALQRAKNNLVNGALVYIANDITLGDGTTQKKGFYFCQNVDGEGRLTMAGGGELEAGAVTTDKIGNSAVTEEKIGADAVTGEKIANGAVDADKLDTGFLNSLATKDQYDALTAGMVVGEGEEPTIANAINKAIYDAIDVVLEREY